MIRQWEKLLAAVQEHAPSLPSADIHRATMEQMVGQVKDVKARQDSLQAARQATTQELEALLTKTSEASIRLRGVVKADIGPKSEQLVHFGIAPLRKRSRRAAEIEVKPPEITGT
jgi:outer membrane murein-binding lipoprotein Lpp